MIRGDARRVYSWPRGLVDNMIFVASPSFHLRSVRGGEMDTIVPSLPFDFISPVLHNLCRQATNIDSGGLIHQTKGTASTVSLTTIPVRMILSGGA